MPFVSIDNVPATTGIVSDVRIGLWKLTETADNFYSLFPHLNQYSTMLSSRYKSPSRQLEFLAAHALLFLMTHDKEIEIGHLPTGKPTLPQFHVSVSHTRGYVTLMLSTSCDVAIDIERMNSRVQRVVSRFVRSDERAEDIISQLLHWSAKETLYKLHSDDNLEYFDMRVIPFETREQGVMEVVNLKCSVSVPIRYLVTSDYVMTYAIE